MAWQALLLSLSLAASARAERPVVIVTMNQMAVASDAEASSIRTPGVATCIAVFLYDAQRRIGALAHVGPNDEPRIFTQRLINAALAAGAGRLDAQLIGGWNTSPIESLAGFQSTSPSILAGIKTALAARKIPIRREETLTIPFQNDRKAIRNLSLDLDSGIVSDY